MKKIFIIITIIFPQFVSASTFYVELSKDENTPTPQQIVQESLLSTPPPQYTLNAFNTATPTKVEYLIKIRATGNLKTIMDNSPNWTQSRLQQFLSLTYSNSIDSSTIQLSLNNDTDIRTAYQIDESIKPELSVPIANPTSETIKYIPKKSDLSINMNSADIVSAWELSEGMGYVGIADTGLQSDHPNLRAFDGLGNYTGGNILDGFYHIDFGETYDGILDFNVDELEPVPAIDDFADCDSTDGIVGNMLAVSSFVGHGTHVSGLIGARGGLAPGICKNCGISMMKFYGAKSGACNERGGTYYLFAEFTFDNFYNTWATLSNIGVGTINLSAGLGYSTPNICELAPDRIECLLIKSIDDKQILLTGAAGNHRTNLQYPASDSRVASAGGFDESNAFWNESPNGVDNTDSSINANCPQYPANSGFSISLGLECGSNFSFSAVNHKTDVVTQARNVFSIFYKNQEWNPFLPQSCTDAFDGNPNDGYGLCTGTSMSAPQTTAIFQLMRSTNPLLPNGTSDPINLIGLRNILNATAERSLNGLGHSDYFGYGEPSARKSLEVILGKSNNTLMKTRLTPMFAITSMSANNNFYSPFPQVATAFLLNNGVEYISDISKPLVNEYTEFWYDTINLTLPAPRAEFYVFTTNNNPFTGTKDLIPLRRMEKTPNGTSNRNDTYAVSTAEIESFHNDSYNYAGIEGYILPTCTPMPGCIPNGAIPLYRDEADNLNHKLVPTFTAPATSTLLGYVYLNQDTDGDGLIDGQEIILGTNINVQDTDGDTVPDGVEYPAAGVPYSDPLISDIIFKDGFE